MAKELPFFKFEPNQWENGNIQMVSREQKGLFIDLCSMYWSRLGDLPKKLAIQKICAGNANALDLLCEDGIISIKDDFICIDFLNEQLLEFENISSQNSKNAKEGWEKRRKEKVLRERNATALNPQSETHAIREEEIRVDKSKEEEDNNTPTARFSFFKKLKENGAEENLANEWITVRKTKKLAQTKTAFEQFIVEVEKSGKNINEILKLCVVQSWGGFKNTWLKNLEEKEKSSAQKEKEDEPKLARMTISEAEKTFQNFANVKIPGVNNGRE